MLNPSVNNSLTAATRDAVSEEMSVTQSIENVCVEDTMVLSFVNMMTQFLEAMNEVFPECPRVTVYLTGWKATLTSGSGDSAHFIEIGKQAIASYNESMGPYYTRCLNRDETLLNENIDLMINIGMAEKWTDDLDPETKDAIWQYILRLNEFANMNQMCAALPHSAIQLAQNMAKGIADKIERNEMALSDVSIVQMVEEVAKQINTDELMSSLDTTNLGDPSMLTSMMQNMMQQINL